MPMDPEPVENGNLEIVGTIRARSGSMVPKVQYRDPGEMSMFEDDVRYVAHFASCPDADRWRRG